MALAAPTPPVVESCAKPYWCLLKRYFGSEAPLAYAVMMAESGGNPQAISHTCDRGLMQINCIHAAKVQNRLDSLYDPETNIRVAKQIRDGSGWGAWVTFNQGKHIKFLGGN